MGLLAVIHWGCVKRERQTRELFKALILSHMLFTDV